MNFGVIGPGFLNQVPTLNPKSRSLNPETETLAAEPPKLEHHYHLGGLGFRV